MRSFFYYSLMLLSACQLHKEKEIRVEITTHGKLRQELRQKTLYLEEQKTHALLDSVQVKDSVAYFSIAGNKVTPDAFLRVVYIDTFRGQWYRRPIGFPNPYVPKTIYSSFLPDERPVVIHAYTFADIAKGSFVGGARNEPYLKQVFLYYPDTEIPTERNPIIAQNIRKIRSYQSDFYFASQLFNYRTKFTVAELQQQLAVLGNDFKGSQLDSQFAQYLKAPYVLEKQVPPTLELPTMNGTAAPLLQNKARFTLIVFWASWCGPCRKEIPALKKIAAKYPSELLGLCSVSIDTEPEKWRNALGEEQMPWQQLLARGKDRDLIGQYFLLPFIPKAYLVNSTGKVIRIFEGNNEDMEEELDKLK